MKIAPSDTLPTCPNLTVAGAGVGVAAAVPDALTAGTGCGFGPQAASANTETRVRRTKVFTALATPGVVGGVYRRSRGPRRDRRGLLPPARSPRGAWIDGSRERIRVALELALVEPDRLRALQRARGRRPASGVTGGRACRVSAGSQPLVEVPGHF